SLASTPGGRAVARLVTTEGAEPEVEQVLRTIKEESRKHRARVIVRAKERGELPAAADPYLMVDSVWAVVMGRLMRFNERLDRTTCKRLIDLVVTGAEHGGGAIAPSRRSRRPPKTR